MLVHQSLRVIVFAVVLLGVAPAAHAGLEFCFTPECSDGDPCTCDFESPDGTCSHDPRTRWASAARASGVQIDLLGKALLPPTPDSNVQNPDSLATLPLDPLAHVELMRVEEIEENPNNNLESHGRAEVTASQIRVLDRGLGQWLLSVDSLRSVSDSFANDQTATSTTEGSTLQNVVLNGVPLGDINEPMDFTIQDPVLHQRIDVRLLQKLPVGAAAGDPAPDPEFGVMVSGVTVNAIRVTVRNVADPANPKIEADIIIGRADSRVDRFGAASCEVSNPQVSGSGYVVALDADEGALDPLRQLTRLRIGEVLLPSTGGEENAELLHVGPILDPIGQVLLESNAAFSNTAGTVDPAAESAESNTVSAIEQLRAFDVGSGPQLSVDLVRAECSADLGDGASQSQGKTTLVGLKVAGKDLCEALDAQGACTPAPNTEVALGLPGLEILLNEQIPDPASSGSGITVNAIHVRVLGAGNSLGLPIGANLIVAKAHCDVKPAAGAAPAPPSTPAESPPAPADAKLGQSLPLGLPGILNTSQPLPGPTSVQKPGGLLSGLTSLLRLPF